MFQLETQKILDQYKDDIPVLVVEIAESLGIEVYVSGLLGAKQSGGIVKTNKPPYTIYVNKNHSFERQRFTIAHEIGHYLEHREAIDRAQEDGIIERTHFSNVFNAEQMSQKLQQGLHRSDAVQYSSEEQKMEVMANRFAAELLMPEDKFREVWQQASSAEEVAKVFYVSESAANFRGQNLLSRYLL